MSACRSCGAPVEWIKLRPQMKKHPLNPISKKVIMLGDIISDGAPVGKIVDGYESHFATCPDAGKWREKR